MVVNPKPRDVRSLDKDVNEIIHRLHEVLSRPSTALDVEAQNLEEAYLILNDALS